MNDVTDLSAQLTASRILVIDDNRAIHQDFRKIFGTSERSAPSAAELALFGGDPGHGTGPEFRIDSAYQGQEGLELVRLAQEERCPYAMAFIDVRMPPGWDGIETTAQIWRQDPDIQIVICTAYSDYSWSEMLAKLGRSDRLVILKKPFDTIEVLQLASALTEKWRLARQSRSTLEDLERKVAVRTRELLQESEMKGSILESSLDCIITIDHQGKICEFNPAAEATFGLTREAARGQVMVDLIVPPRLRDAHRRGFAHYLATGTGPILGKRLELEAIRADGTEFPIELAINALRATSPPMFTGFIRDITARKQADEKIRRLNRVYAVLSGINGAIVRIRDRRELFEEACRIAVEAGGLPFVSMSVVDETGMRLRPAASAGDDGGFLATLHDRLSLRDDSPAGHGISARSVRQKRALVLNDVENAPEVKNKKALAARGIRSMAAFPLLVEGRAVGAFALHSAELGFFDDEEMKLLQEVAGNIAFALEHIEREEKVRRLTRVHAVLSGINALIVRARDRDELFKGACAIAVGAGGFKLAWIAVADRSTMQLTPVAWEGAAGDYLERMPLGLNEADENFGLAGRAACDKKPVMVEDMEHDPRVLLRGPASARGFHSLAILPLTVSDTVVGVLALYANEIGFFNEVEMKPLVELSDNIAFAVDHIDAAAKLGRMTRVNAMLSGINAAIVRIRDRQELFAEACRIAVSAGGFILARAVEVDLNGKARIAANTEADSQQYQRLIDEYNADPGNANTLLARAMRSGQPSVSNDIVNDTRVPGRAVLTKDGTFALAVLPIIVEKRAAGAIVLRAREPGMFDEGELRLLVELVSNIAFALEHMEKEEKVQRLTRVYAVLSGINTLIVRVHSRDELFQKACEIAVEAGGFRMAWIGLVDQAAQKIVPVASAGADAGFLANPRQWLSLTDELPGPAVMAVRDKQAVVVDELDSDPRMRDRKAHLDPGVRSLVILPLLVAGVPVAVFGLHALHAGYFDEQEMTLLRELAGDIAFAIDHIEKAVKFDKLARIRAVSSEINAAIIRIRERKALLEETCRIVAEHGKFEMAWIGALDHDARQIEPVAWKGFSDQTARAVSWARISTAKGALSEAMLTRKASVRNDIGDGLPGGQLSGEALAQGCHASICLPLVVDDKVVALVVLFATERGFFDTDELALLDEVASDISFALHAIEKHNRLEYVSYYDVLTGLANRTLFLERASQYIRSAARDGHQLALFLVDLQRFKNINDSLGQAAGDALLKLVAQWLAREVGDVNLLARIEADHFAVVLPKVSEDGSVARLLDRAMDAFEEHPFHLEGGVFRVATKSGVALFPGDGATADALFKNAEAALKKAKASGDRYLFYTAQMTDAVAGKLTLENRLREALGKDEFVLHYQPKVNLMSGKLTGAEALIRWHDPRTGLVPPGRFIPILEETGMINEVGRWAMRQAVEQYLRWLDAGLPAKRIAVNVSPLQLRNRDFVAEVAQAIAIDPRAPAGLELEITENLVMEDVKHSIATLRAIRDLGVTIAIDDFGTGFSSLSYLSKLPVDTLKIDRSFVVEMTAPEARSLVPAIIGLAHSLKLKVVAEGVETEDQSRLLRLLNCDEMQGYLFGKPVPSEIFQAGYLQAPR